VVFQGHICSVYEVEWTENDLQEIMGRIWKSSRKVIFAGSDEGGVFIRVSFCKMVLNCSAYSCEWYILSGRLIQEDPLVSHDNLKCTFPISYRTWDYCIKSAKNVAYTSTAQFNYWSHSQTAEKAIHGIGFINFETNVANGQFWFQKKSLLIMTC
jgi:hypothetical protein